MSNAGKLFSLSGGDIHVWLEPEGAICLKVNNPYGDPLDMGVGEVRELIRVLTLLADEDEGILDVGHQQAEPF